MAYDHVRMAIVPNVSVCCGHMSLMLMGQKASTHIYYCVLMRQKASRLEYGEQVVYVFFELHTIRVSEGK